MSRTYENSYVVNSFHAINAKDGSVYIPDAQGYITAKAGDQIKFENPYERGNYVSVNTITFFTKDTALKVDVNPGQTDALYPLYIAANDKKGVQYMRIDCITILNDCTFYYEALVS